MAEKDLVFLLVEMDELTMPPLSFVVFLSDSIYFAVVKYKSCRGTDVFIFIPGIQMQQKPARESTLTAIALSLPHPTQLK